MLKKIIYLYLFAIKASFPGRCNTSELLHQIVTLAEIHDHDTQSLNVIINCTQRDLSTNFRPLTKQPLEANTTKTESYGKVLPIKRKTLCCYSAREKPCQKKIIVYLWQADLKLYRGHCSNEQCPHQLNSTRINFNLLF